jgi:hypothetical protein
MSIALEALDGILQVNEGLGILEWLRELDLAEKVAVAIDGGIARSNHRPILIQR